MDSLQGQLLIAAPTLLDPNFVQTVTLVVRHDEEGAMGLVLNRPTKTSVGEVWEQVCEKPLTFEGVIHHGGPCDGPIMLLHPHESCSDFEVLPGVHFSAEKEHVEWLVASGGDDLKCFVGYAGWGAGQLEEELESGSWLLAPAVHDQIFGAQVSLWLKLVRTLAAAAFHPGINPRIIPDDPSVN